MFTRMSKKYLVGLYSEKTFETRICVWLIIYAQIYSIFFLKKNTQIFMGNFFLYKVPCFVKNLKGKNHTYYYTFPRFNLAKRVNPPITKIGHVLKNVFFLSYFSAQHKDVGVLFCKYFMTFLIICPVANALSLN